MLLFSLRSLWNRRFVASLTMLTIALSVGLILGVERLRSGAQDSFANSASGIDLIVAPRGGQLQILLATVFGIGGTGTGMGWDSFEWLEGLPEVAWAVPIQIGDNHRGFPVIGTTTSFFKYFRVSGGRPLRMAEGVAFTEAEPDRAVVGSEVAARFGYGIGSVIINAHGAGAESFEMHDDAPFTISGVLAPTGTSVDRMVYVSLEGFNALHAKISAPLVDPLNPGVIPATPQDGQVNGEIADVPGHKLEKINAVYLGLVDRTAVLGLQRAINDRTADALSAVLPAVALAELWGITDIAETVMRLMAWAVALAGVIGMVVMLSATLDTRRREFAILRSVGATPPRIFGLILIEAAVLTAAGLMLGLILLALATIFTDPILLKRFGLQLGFNFFGSQESMTLIAIFCAGLVASLIPAMRVYRMTLADGLSVRI
jgi:putative ABC transport system permease protein